MPLTLGRAKAAAREWVLARAAADPAITGAFFHGSTTTLPDDGLMSASSDVDVMIVRPDDDSSVRPGKFAYRGVLLEVSYLTADEVRSPEHVLGQYQLAGSFRAPGIILDHDGHLAAVQTVVGREFARRDQVRRRCEHARDKVLGGFPLRVGDPWPNQNNAWLFPAGVTTHILLVAGLRNPTVRRRYQTTRELLTEYGQLGIYPTLLDLLGATGITAERATQHLATLNDAFDAAAAVIRSPFFFAADISEAGRPVAIDGSAEMIAEGYHREAMFWVAASWCRCMLVLRTDAPDTDIAVHERGFRDLLTDLGIASVADIECRRQAIRAALPSIWSVAEQIMATNPEIEDE